MEVNWWETRIYVHDKFIQSKYISFHFFDYARKLYRKHKRCKIKICQTSNIFTIFVILRKRRHSKTFGIKTPLSHLTICWVYKNKIYSLNTFHICAFSQADNLTVINMNFQTRLTCFWNMISIFKYAYAVGAFNGLTYTKYMLMFAHLVLSLF